MSKRLVAGLRWTALSRGFTQLLTWASTIVVVRILDPSHYGLAALAALVAGYFSLLGEMGFTTALVQRQTTSEHVLRYVFGALLVVGIALFGAVFLVAPIAASYFDEPLLAPLIRIAGVQFLLLPFNVLPQSRLSIDLRFKAIGTSTMTSAAAGTLATLLLALAGAGPFALTIGAITAAATRTLVINLYAPIRFGPRFGLAPLQDLIRFSRVVLAERSVWYWYTQSDTLVIGSAFGSTLLGIYAVAKDLAEILVSRLSEIANVVTLPIVSSIKHDGDAIRNGYTQLVRMLSYLVFPAFLGLALVAEDLIPIVLGEKWAVATTTFQLLCLAFPLRVLSSVTSPIATAIGRPDITLRIVAVGAVVMPASMIAASSFGLEAVAGVWPVVFPLVFGYGAYQISRAIGVPMTEYVRHLASPILVTLAMAACVLLSRAFILDSVAPALRLAASVAIGAAAFPLLVYLLRRGDFLALASFSRALVRR